jgi:protein-S-isoprenylcysteine O-methyltransferase Ste14
MNVRRVLLFLMGTAIFSGLPMVAWGWRDWEGFAANPVRLAYCVTAAVLQFFAARAVSVGKEKTRETVSRQRLAVVLLQLFGLGMIVLGPWDDRHGVLALGGGSVLRCAGLMLFTLGMAVVLMAEVWLGRFFSIQVELKEGHQLITEGPYHYVRHPRYLGVILFHLGYSLVFLSGAGLLCAAGATVVLFWRIHDEEVLLRQEFGVKWEAYARTSRKLLPFIY